MHTPGILRKAEDLIISGEQGKLGLCGFLSQTSPYLHILTQTQNLMPTWSQHLYFESPYKCGKKQHNLFGIMFPGSTEGNRDLSCTHRLAAILEIVVCLDAIVFHFLIRDCVPSDLFHT